MNNLQYRNQKKKMSQNSMKILFFTLSLIIKCFAISIDQNDLMNGNGLFSSQSISAYSLDDHTHSFISWNSSNVLRLEKPSQNQISYQKGLSYTFVATQVKHIQFKCSSTNTDVEDSNLRITDPNGTTLVLFRAGRGGLIRVNEKQMISFYNDSISTNTDIRLTQIDLKIYWQTKTIQVFVNQKYKDVCKFFDEKVGPVNKILLYNLYSSVSYWSDIVVCKEICYGFNWQGIPFMSIVLLSIFMMVFIL